VNEDKTMTGAGAGPHGEPGGPGKTSPPAGDHEGRPGRALLVGGYKGLSGNAYLVGELDAAGTGTGGEPARGRALAAIPVRTPARCGHGETICRECAGTWVTGGWTLHFGRTAGGRRLRDELGGAALAEMAARRAAGLDPAAVRAHQVMADAVRAGERDRGPYRARVVRPAVAGDGASARKRDLEGGTRGLSSIAYLVGELDTSHWDADGTLVPGVCRAAIPIRKPRRCDHGETVCLECAEVWMYDWKFYFDRTIGGRLLRDGLGGEAALAVMAARRAAWENQAAEPPPLTAAPAGRPAVGGGSAACSPGPGAPGEGGPR
jgi:hypothetical protein